MPSRVRPQQVKKSRQPCDSVICHEVSGSGVDLQPCVQASGEVIGCFRRHERIRVGAEYCSFPDACCDAFNVDVSCEEAIEFGQCFQWFSKACHQHETSQLPRLRQRREYPQGSDRTEGMCHNYGCRIGHSQRRPESVLPSCLVRIVRVGERNDGDCHAFSFKDALKPWEPVCIGRRFVPVDDDDALDGSGRGVVGRCVHSKDTKGSPCLMSFRTVSELDVDIDVGAEVDEPVQIEAVEEYLRGDTRRQPEGVTGLAGRRRRPRCPGATPPATDSHPAVRTPLPAVGRAFSGCAATHIR